ncbi:GNAT family N-acetyltransferase, partial [Streptomyces spongiicola]|uniref:GNAT family N-acetyltransferase n=1 Tax=Streptomyces spongiicola TaxID=1690221 RepID=UPI0033D71D17
MPLPPRLPLQARGSALSRSWSGGSRGGGRRPCTTYGAADAQGIGLPAAAAAASGELVMDGIAVDAAHRGKGTGGLLLREIAAVA